MKKYKFIHFIIIIMCIILTFTSCTPLPFKNEVKPNNEFYLNCIKSLLDNNESDNISISIIDMNYYKEIILTDKEKKSLKDSIKEINSEFLSKKTPPKGNPQFKMIVTLKKQKYCINIFDENYITIHSWDGDIVEDYIDISKSSLNYNLYYFCLYVFKEHKS